MASSQVWQRKTLRVAHLSDLHFSKISWDIGQFFSKRWVGNCNLLLARKRISATKEVASLCEELKREQVQLVVITGDLTSTAHRAEFALAAEFVKKLQNEKFEVLLVPGNHDHYTKGAFKEKRFYQFFPLPLSQQMGDQRWTLQENGVEIKPLNNNWWLVALDTAIPTSLISSQGLFSEELEENLKKALLQIPPSQKVIVVNHFPLFQQDHPRKVLRRSEALIQTLQQFSHVKLYLHGHTHRHSLADLRSIQLPIVVDAGSTGLRPSVSWNLLELSDSSVQISAKALKASATVPPTPFTGTW